MDRTTLPFPLLGLYVTALFALVAAGCSLFGDDPRPLTRSTWRLQAFLADDAFPPSSRAPCSLTGVDCVSDDRTYTVTFRTDGGLGVQADCNTCGGGYRRDRETLIVDQLFCTEVYCGPASRGAEFAQALGEAHSYRTRDGQLLIAYGDERGLLLRTTSSRSEAPSPSR
jgi:heat shock protein HslJ